MTQWDREWGFGAGPTLPLPSCRPEEAVPILPPPQWNSPTTCAHRGEEGREGRALCASLPELALRKRITHDCTRTDPKWHTELQGGSSGEAGGWLQGLGTWLQPWWGGCGRNPGFVFTPPPNMNIRARQLLLGSGGLARYGRKATRFYPCSPTAAETACPAPHPSPAESGLRVEFPSFGSRIPSPTA